MAQLAKECFCGTFAMIFCRPRRMVAHQRPKLAARELGGVPKRATVQVHCVYGKPEWSLGEKPKIEFTTFIQPLTLSRRFLTPRKVTPEVLQWLVSRSLVMHGVLTGAAFGSGQGRVGTPRQCRRSCSKGRRLSGNTVRPQQTFTGLRRARNASRGRGKLFVSFSNGLLARCGLTRSPEAGLGSREAGHRNSTEEREAGWVVGEPK